MYIVIHERTRKGGQGGAPLPKKLKKPTYELLCSFTNVHSTYAAMGGGEGGVSLYKLVSTKSERGSCHYVLRDAKEIFEGYIRRSGGNKSFG